MNNNQRIIHLLSESVQTKTDAITHASLFHVVAAPGISTNNRKQAIVSLLNIGVDINSTDAMGKTPLFYAGTSCTVRLLLDLGADPNIVDCNGRTVLEGRIDMRSALARMLFLVTTKPNWKSPGYCKLAKEFAAIIIMALLKRTKFQPDMIRMIGRYIRAS